jgi:hypothetical protein
VLVVEVEETGMVMEDMVDIQHSMVKIITQVVEEDLEMLLMVDMVVQEVGEVEVVEVEDLMDLVVHLGVMDILVVMDGVICILEEEEEEEALLALVVTLLGEEVENTMVK